MPRYKLAILKDIKAIYFDIEKLRDLKVDDTLKETDNFTMQFVNENQLLSYLKTNNLYTETKKYKLQVLYRNNNTDKKIPVLYGDCRKYMDVYYLRNLIQSYSKDIVFLEKMANHYSLGKSSYNPQLANVAALRRYINDVRFSSTKEAFFADYVIKALDDIFAKAVYKINKNTGEAEINYRGLRDLALFTKRYTDGLLKKEYEDTMKAEKINGFEYNENYDEPDFAPNSEEEEMYLSYLESLKDEESDYNFERGKSR